MGVKNKRKSTDLDDTTPAVDSSNKVKKAKQEERKPDVAVIIRPKEKKPKRKKSKGHKSVVTPVVEEGKETTAAEVPEPVPTKKRKPRTIKVEGEKKSVDSADGVSTVKKKVKKSKKSKKAQKEIKPKDIENLKAKGVEYLKEWKNNRTIWKFQKLRQKWLIDNMLDATQLTDGLFSVLMEYFSGAKGRINEVLVEKAAAIIKTVEESKKPDIEDVKYKRSRIIMQSLGEAK